MFSKSQNLVIIVGPTAVGKSRVAVILARHFRGEIINADSTQVYSGFNIGTDKPDEEMRRLAPHHLLDVMPPDVQFNAADFVALATKTAAEVIARGNLPIVVGGTGLYIQALLDGLFPGPGADRNIRKELKAEVETYGIDKLYTELERIDPEYASRIGRRDKVRIIRALEVYRLTGKPISSHFQQTVSPVKEFHILKLGLFLDRKELCSRIEQRVDRMFEKGLVDEVKNLINQGIDPRCPAFKALGYRSILSYLSGDISLMQAIELTKIKTRQYAKRQMTWFRKMPGLVWFSPEEIELIKKYLITHLK